ncbi:MAG: carbohydrate kinase family protein [bacterium]|nr:carbohydrate kinase family protein [bacterium]
MFDIISIGSAICDLFLKSSRFPLDKQAVGEKIEIDELLISSGGGGTNTASGFARLGLNTACVARLGDDLFGKFVVSDLEKEAFDKKYLVVGKGENTDYSTILVNPDGSRTILVYRGKTMIDAGVFPWGILEETKWLYLASVEGNVDLLIEVVKRAREKGVEVVLNPGNRELRRIEKLVSIFPKLKALVLNREEAEACGVSERQDGYPEIVVITSGRQGAKLFSSQKNLFAESFVDLVVDETGAGDAFSSGFVTGLVKGLPLEVSLKMGMANGASVVSKFGAKAGLLHEGELSKWMRRPLMIG